MTRDQFIEKYLEMISYYGYDKRYNQEFISDLSSLFNLRTEEEVRAKLKEKELKYERLKDGKYHPGYGPILDADIHRLKWFLLMDK